MRPEAPLLVVDGYNVMLATRYEALLMSVALSQETAAESLSSQHQEPQDRAQFYAHFLGRSPLS